MTGRYENGHFVCPDVETLKKYRLIVTTLHTARTLRLKGFKKDSFTHIFIDEAAQVMENQIVCQVCYMLLPIDLMCVTSPHTYIHTYIRMPN